MLLAATAAEAANPYAGLWQFSFSGQDAGSGSASVDERGRIQGAGHSNRFQMDLTLAGEVSASGAFTLTATPAGSTSTGATFTGQATGSRASGSWQNDAAGLSGSWQAERTGSAAGPGTAGPGTSGTNLHCQIDGDSFDAAPPVLADVMIPPHGDQWKFRILAGHGLGLAPQGDRTEIQVKADQVLAPGTYAMSKAPLWRSVILFVGREYKVDQGSFVLDHYSPRGDGRVAGTLSFDAGGHHGQCTFALPMTVHDMPALMGQPVH